MTISSGVTENQIERENSERSGGDGCSRNEVLKNWVYFFFDEKKYWSYFRTWRFMITLTYSETQINQQLMTREKRGSNKKRKKKKNTPERRVS